MHAKPRTEGYGPASALAGLETAASFYAGLGILAFRGDGWSEILRSTGSNLEWTTRAAFVRLDGFQGASHFGSWGGRLDPFFGLPTGTTDWTTQAAFVRLDGFDGAANFGQIPTSLIGVTGDGSDRVEGTHGPDWIDGGAGHDSLRGGDGADTLEGGSGHDQLAGQAGDDVLAGGDGHDTIFAGAGDDRIDGGNGADRVVAGSGNDSVEGGNGADLLLGKAGADTLSGGAAADVLDGGADNDRLDGGDGADTLMGGAGSDTLLGGNGQDDLIGGSGNDTMDGGYGADRFFFDRSFGSDRIEAFQSGVDLLIFEGFPEGPGHLVVTQLEAGLWHIDTAAGDITLAANRFDPDTDLVFV